jgi:glycosyltransferase involved in cell wall biosynthesis
MALDNFHLSVRDRRVLRALIPVVCEPVAARLGLVEPILQHVEATLASFANVQRSAILVGLSAFELLRRDRPDAELMLIQPEDPALAQELQEIPGVRLLPRGTETPRIIFQSSWISVLCSEREAFGLVLIESLACGTPVVGTRDGAIPEIIDRPEVGQLFDGDERNLARALAETLELREDPNAAEACRSRASDFSIERSAAAHEGLFRELLSR